MWILVRKEWVKGLKKKEKFFRNEIEGAWEVWRNRNGYACGREEGVGLMRGHVVTAGEMKLDGLKQEEFFKGAGECSEGWEKDGGVVVFGGGGGGEFGEGEGACGCLSEGGQR